MNDDPKLDAATRQGYKSGFNEGYQQGLVVAYTTAGLLIETLAAKGEAARLAEAVDALLNAAEIGTPK